MVHIERNTPVVGAPGYFVAVTGEYGPLDFVPCATQLDGDPVCAFLRETVLGE